MNEPHHLPNNIYETIVQKIIRKCNKEPLDSPSYKPFDITRLTFSPKLSETMAEVECWRNVAKCVSREKCTALLLINAASKAPLPIFTTTATFQLKQFITTLEGQFITPAIRAEFIAYYCKYKQTKNAFSKLARLWRIRKTPIRIQTDLYMNELDASHPTTFKLVQPGGIYLFSLPNLARIIVDSITNQSGMFVEPLPIKNPYTNNPLSKSDLYNIYFAIKFQLIIIHEMLEKFFRCEFNVFEFRRKHESELRDLAVVQYANTSSVEELSQDVSEMLIAHQMTGRIKIASGFPKKKLVEAMRPFLRLYLLERYSFCSVTRQYSKKQVCLALKRFASANPSYGRLVLKNSNLSVSATVDGPREPRWVPPFEITAPNPENNPFTSPSVYELNEQMRCRPAEQKEYVTEFVMRPEWCSENYLKSHIYDECVFDRYVEMGDRIEIYMSGQEEYEYEEETGEWTEWTPPTPQLQLQQRIRHQPIVLSEIATNASNILTSLGVGNLNRISTTYLPDLHRSVSYQEQSRNTRNLTDAQLQENARAILERLGHSTGINRSNHPTIDNITNNIIYNGPYIYNQIHGNDTATLNTQEEDDEEDEDEIVVNNTDSDSDAEWMEEEDSVS